MMEPRFERLRMLGEALDFAGRRLNDPIERLEVRGGQVLVWAGEELLVLDYAYANGFDPQGNLLLGGGSWSVSEGELRRPSVGLAKLRGLFGFGRPS